MYPILWQHGSFSIPTWHVFFVVASLSGFFYFRFLTKRFYPELLEHVHSSFLLVYVGGLLGAHFLSVFIESPKTDRIDYLELDSLTFFGGFLGAAITLKIWLSIKKLPNTPFWDLMCAPLFLGLALGRLGCFFNGDDYGIPAPKNTDASFPWWAVTFPNHADPIARYPVQLMESCGALFIAVLLTMSYRKLSNIREGAVGSLGVLSYCFLRFYLESFRDDERGWVIENSISTSQGISVILTIMIVFHYAFRKHREVLR